jgi:hypothetical protein
MIAAARRQDIREHDISHSAELFEEAAVSVMTGLVPAIHVV